MLTSKQRAQLRKLANPLNDTLIIGKEGVTEGVVAQVEVLLENHELVKGKVLENALLTPATVQQAICEETKAEGVQVIGAKFVIYRQSSDVDKRKIELLSEDPKQRRKAAKAAAKPEAKPAAKSATKSTGKPTTRTTKKKVK